MKKLFLLRHAEASNDFSSDDNNRALTLNGLGQANDVGKYLKSQGHTIDHVLCSSARRTKMTLKSVQDGGANIHKTDYLDSLYNAPANQLLNDLFTASGNNVMIIAHNPGIHQFAGMMTKTGEPKNVEKLMYGYAPATLSILECPFSKWVDANEGQSKLIDLYTSN